MNYDLTDKEQRKRFVKYANSLLKHQRTLVSLEDRSNRTLSQNCYLHVLCRILAQDTGTSEYYAKQVYFKELANPDIFLKVTKDPVTGKMINITRSSADLTIQEMSRAINNFIRWASENGYILPEADLQSDGTMEFRSMEDQDAFHQAEIETSKEPIV
jgi:hypothetical protein